LNIAVGNTHTFVELSYHAYVRYRISYDILQYIDRVPIKADSNNVMLSTRRINFVQMYLQSVLTGTSFSAFALESFINYYGRSRLPANDFDSDYERLPVVKKWMMVIKEVADVRLVKNEEPLKSIRALFAERDKLAHDKPKIVDNQDDFITSIKDMRLSVTPDKAFQTLLITESFMKSLEPQYRGHFLVIPFFQICWENWQKENLLEIPPEETFHGARFPGFLEYALAIRYATGEELTGYIEDFDVGVIRKT